MTAEAVSYFNYLFIYLELPWVFIALHQLSLIVPRRG